jgi:hypothetical protein
MNERGKSDRSVLCAGRRVLLAGGSPAGPFQAGSVAKGGGNASPGAAGLHGAGRRVIVGRVMVARAGRRGGNAAACSAIRLSHGVGCCSARCNVVGERRAGQGAHREVGSEGFAAKRRAVAEQGEPVGQIQAEASLHYGGEANTWNAWTQQGVCGRHGVKAACVTPGGLVRSCPPGRGPGRISRRGEVAGDAVREVGVTRGTWEPRTNTSLGTAPFEGRRAVSQKQPTLGKGSRRRWSNGCRWGRVGDGGLMVAAAMTEASSLRTPAPPAREAR